MNIMIIDTETAPIRNIEKVQPWNMLTYDGGFQILNPRTGETFVEGSYIIKQIFYGQSDRMKSAYYANKIPRYIADIEAGKRIVIDWFEFIAIIHEYTRQFKIKAICAHNARFDVCSLNKTMSWCSFGEISRALPDVEIWDSMKMARSTFASRPSYRKFCENNSFMTKHAKPRPRVTAEILYRFLTQDLDFEESHTALEDVYIEAEIVKYCFKTHMKMERVLYNAGE